MYIFYISTIYNILTSFSIVSRQRWVFSIHLTLPADLKFDVSHSLFTVCRLHLQISFGFVVSSTLFIYNSSFCFTLLAMITQTSFTVVLLVYSPVRLAAQIQESRYFFRYFASNLRIFKHLRSWRWVVRMWMGCEANSISTANSLTVFACHVTQHTNDMTKTLDFLKHILWRRKLNIDKLSLSSPTSELSTWKMDNSLQNHHQLRACINLEIWNAQYNGKVFNCD